MEVVEVCTKKRPCIELAETNTPCNAKVTKRYVQPPRMKSFAPERMYRPPAKPLDSCTTYHLSYITLDNKTARAIRAQPYRPIQTLVNSAEKFAQETTTKLSYQPIWNINKTEPIRPKSRTMTGTGPIESTTTTRYDYAPKYADKIGLIVPCGNIRTSTGPLDDRTTTRLSYVNPGTTEPITSFKPVTKYCPPTVSIAKDTTQKLSYQPFAVQKKELFPWAQKPAYKHPSTAMAGKTTYTESYLENEGPSRPEPCLPREGKVLPSGAQFLDKTIYKESYLPCQAPQVEKIVPPGHIFISTEKMSDDTTTKLSYQPVKVKKRAPILPRSKKLTGEGKMQTETTNRCDFMPKTIPPPKLIVPCNNIQTSKDKIRDETTTGLSFMPPGPVERIQSCKPIAEYCRPSAKVETETINKLSYQTWTPIPKEDMPWARKTRYEPPKDPMAVDTVYHMSYPEPGYYIEEDNCTPECPCPEN